MFALNHIVALLRDQRGATAVEYGLIAAMIVLAMIAALQTFANEATDMWDYVESNVATA